MITVPLISTQTVGGNSEDNNFKSPSLIAKANNAKPFVKRKRFVSKDKCERLPLR